MSVSRNPYHSRLVFAFNIYSKTPLKSLGLQPWEIALLMHCSIKLGATLPELNLRDESGRENGKVIRKIEPFNSTNSTTAVTLAPKQSCE